MKFSCDRCDGRYQIPDEKVAGKRVRYTCRKCGNSIVVDGTALVTDAGPFDVSPTTETLPSGIAQSIPPSVVPTGSALLAPAPARISAPTPAKATAPARVSAPTPTKATAPSPAKPSANLAKTVVSTPENPSASLSKAVASTPRKETPPTPATETATPAPLPVRSGSPAIPELPVWHVAIAGSPFGPLRRSELLARVTKGEAGPESLVWREGLADWKPLATIAELALALEDPPSKAGEPVPPPLDPDSAAPVPGVRVESDSDPGPMTLESPPPRSAAGANANPARLAPAFADEHTAPTRVVNVVPPVFESEPPPPPSDAPPVSAAIGASVEPIDEAPLVMPRRSSPTGLILVGAFVAVAVVGAFVIGRRSGDEVAAGASPTATSPDGSSPSRSVPEAPTTPPSDQGAPGLAIEDIGDDGDLAVYAGAIDAGVARTSPTSQTGSARAPSTNTTTPTTTPAPTEEGPLPMPTSGTRSNGDSFETHAATSRVPAATGPLEASQISAVVRTNRGRAQRCYERAATMSGTTPDVRLQVTLRIATSGSVTNAEITGNDFGGVITCVDRIVRSWQFPASTTGGQTTFSLVFSGG